jgi:hypothetical protein
VCCDELRLLFRGDAPDWLCWDSHDGSRPTF